MKLSKDAVINKILEIGLVPPFHNRDLAISKKIVKACVEGGAEVIEFTNRGDLAYKRFSELAEWCDSKFHNVILGVGTIYDAPTASLYINSGTNFVVGPVLNPEISKVCNIRKVPYIPGCFTPSEILRAQSLGSDIVKVFPAKILGPGFISSFLGPFPRSKLMPSGGVKDSKEDIFSWFKAGASVLNIGSELIRKDLVKNRRFEEIKKRVKECLSLVNEAKSRFL